MTGAAAARGGDPLADLAAPDGPLAAGYAHATAGGTAERGAWCAWTFGMFARLAVGQGRHGEAEQLVDRIDALPLPTEGPAGAIGRYAFREGQRLRLALRAAPPPFEGAPA